MELDDRNNPNASNAESLASNVIDTSDTQQHTPQLAPIDGGLAAWRLLAAGFIFEALLWGFPLSFGVFQNYYSKIPEFANHPLISVVGTTASGISYLGALLISPVIKRYPKHQRHLIYIGWPICILSLVAGSFATTLPALIITQGVMYGVGFTLFYYPILSFLMEYWVARRGMSCGIMCSASGFSGAIFPFALEAMLGKYGYQTTLRIIAVGLTVTTGPLIPLLKPRLPPSQEATLGKTDWSFLKRPLFHVYNVSNILQALGYFFPSLYLPSYASSLGLGSVQGALVLALMSIFQVLGQFTFGYLSDHRNALNTLVLVSTVVSAVSVLALWGLAKSLPVLIVFSAIYGFFGAGYVSMWARMGMAVNNDPSSSMATFSIFCAGKGICNIASGYIGAGLLSHVTSLESYGVMKYRSVVIFTGICMALSAVSVGLWQVGPKRLRTA